MSWQRTFKWQWHLYIITKYLNVFLQKINVKVLTPDIKNMIIFIFTRKYCDPSTHLSSLKTLWLINARCVSFAKHLNGKEVNCHGWKAVIWYLAVQGSLAFSVEITTHLPSPWVIFHLDLSPTSTLVLFIRHINLKTSSIRVP